MQKLTNLWSLVDGKKTYIVAFVTALLNLLVAFDVVTVDQLTQVNMVLVALGFSAVRSGLNKI